MRILSISVPQEKWELVRVDTAGKLIRSRIEQWVLVEFEKRIDADLDYQRGQCIVPMIMNSDGPCIVSQEIGTSGSPYLGFEEPGNPRNWEKAAAAYMQTKRPS